MFRFMYKYTLLLTILAIMGCADDDNYVRSPNHAPTIQSITTDRDTVRDNRERVALTCIATDVDGDELSYLWEADYGSFSCPIDYYFSEWFSNYAPPGEQYIRVRVNDKFTYVLDSICVFNSNYPPEVPHSEFPTDGAIDLNTSLQLNWSCTDPDDAELFFHVCLGTSLENIQPLSLPFWYPPIDPITFSAQTTYYWQVEVNDDDGNCATSPIWRFTTR